MMVAHTIDTSHIRELRARVATPDMHAELWARGFGPFQIPIAPLEARKPDPKAPNDPVPPFDPARFDPLDKATWPNDPASGKKPACGKAWQHHEMTEASVAASDKAGLGVGLVCRPDPHGHAPTWFDYDLPDAAAADRGLAVMLAVMAKQGHTVAYVRRREGAPWAAYGVLMDGLTQADRRRTPDGASVELGGKNTQSVIRGPHATGSWRYLTRFDLTDGLWVPTALTQSPHFDELPKFTVAQAHEVYEALCGECGAVKGKGKSGRAGSGRVDRQGPHRHIAPKPLPEEEQKRLAAPSAGVVQALLALLPSNDVDDHDDWVGWSHDIIGACRMLSENEARAIYMGWCADFARSNAGHDKALFNKFWRKRDLLRRGYPDLFSAVAARIGGWTVVKAKGIPYPDVFGLEPVSDEDSVANPKERFAAAMRALREARTEPGQTPATAQRRKLANLAAPAGLPQVPPEVTDWHVRGELGVLISDPGVGKTTLAVEMALAIAHERPELIGSRVLDWSGAVVLVLNETNLDTARAMLIAAETRFGLTEASRKHPVLFYLGPVKLLAKADKNCAPIPTSAAIEFVEALAELRRDHLLALVVFDTLASVLSGLEENSAPDMQAAMEFTAALARAGYCAVQVVHHTRKTPSGKPPAAADARGSSALYGAARCVTALALASKEEHQRFSEAIIIRLSCEKRNDARQPDPVFLARVPVPVAVRDPRDPPGVQRWRDYAVLCPASPVAPFARQADTHAAYAALEAAQAGGLELREAGKPHGGGWVRASTAIAEGLGIRESEARLLITELSDREWIVLETVARQRLKANGSKNGPRRHQEYRLVRPETAQVG